MAAPTEQTDTTEAMSLAGAAGVLGVEFDALLEEIRNTAAEAERPSARD